VSHSPSNITYNQNIKPAMLEPGKNTHTRKREVSGILGKLDFTYNLSILEPAPCQIEPAKSFTQREPNKVDGKFAWGYYLLPPAIVKADKVTPPAR